VVLVDIDRCPGANSARPIQLHPCTGSSCTCCGSIFAPRLDVDVSSSGASAVTMTVSWIVEGLISKSTATVWPTSSWTPVRCTVVKPGSSTVISYAPTRAGIR
jgi:hypothetical protein